MIRFACPKCRAVMTAAKAGAKGKCPRCGHALEVPLPQPAEVEVIDLPTVLPADEPEEMVAPSRKLFVGCVSFLVTTAAVLLLAGGVGAVYWLSHLSGPGEDAEAPLRPDFTLDVDQLVESYRAKVAADARYKGKVILLSGSVAATDQDGGGFVVTVSNGLEFGNRVFCYFPARERAAVEGLRARQFVHVSGRCAGFRGRALWLMDCRVVEDPSP